MRMVRGWTADVEFSRVHLPQATLVWAVPAQGRGGNYAVRVNFGAAERFPHVALGVA